MQIKLLLPIKNMILVMSKKEFKVIIWYYAFGVLLEYYKYNVCLVTQGFA